MGLACIECAIDRALEGDESSSLVRADLVIGMAGSVKSAKIKDASMALMQTIQEKSRIDNSNLHNAVGSRVKVAIRVEFSAAASRRKQAQILQHERVQ